MRGGLFSFMETLNTLFNFLMDFFHALVNPVDNNVFYPCIVLLVMMLLCLMLFMMIFRKY